jgi:hypothetical protein
MPGTYSKGHAVKLFAEPAGLRHRLAVLAGAAVLIALSLLMPAARANAAAVDGAAYWANVNSIAYSQLDDSDGGFLLPSVNAIHNPSGTAIDTANNRIYVSEKGTNQIVWFGLEGSSAGVVNTAPGTVDHPSDVAINPETQTLYWANAGNPGSIGFAHVDGSGGGFLAVPGSTGADVDQPSRIAVDTLHDRVYWWNELSEDFSWVAASGLVGANLSTAGLEFQDPEGMGGIAIEPYSDPEELYFVSGETEGIFHTDPVIGGPPEKILGAYPEKEKIPPNPIGLAFDSIADRFYWANSLADEAPENTLYSATLFGQTRTIDMFPVAPIHGPVFASVLNAPEPVGEPPQISGSEATLSCTLGEWEGDHPGASVYASPTTYSYVWRKGSAVIGGATGGSFTATESGSYSCGVVAENAAGDTESKSKATTVTLPDQSKTITPPTAKTKTTSASPPKSTPPKSPAMGAAKLASNKPAKVKAGGTAVVDVDLTNYGGTALGSTKVCGTLNQQAKKGLKTPSCVTVKSVAGGKAAVAGLKVKTLSSARGTYKLRVSVSGATTASLAAKVQVTRAKSKK